MSVGRWRKRNWKAHCGGRETRAQWVRTGRQINRMHGPWTNLDKATNRDLDFVMGVFRDGMASARGYIERLGPYQSLLLLAIPTRLVEPLKLIAVAVAGEGHWITGTFRIIGAYGCSPWFVESLFQIRKAQTIDPALVFAAVELGPVCPRQGG
jgi:hypothetical protein